MTCNIVINQWHPVSDKVTPEVKIRDPRRVEISPQRSSNYIKN